MTPAINIIPPHPLPEMREADRMEKLNFMGVILQLFGSAVHPSVN